MTHEKGSSEGALSEVLDEIEERHNTAKQKNPAFEEFAVRVARTAADVPWLVKALRRAKTDLEDILKARSSGSEPTEGRGFCPRR
jgi:hypothetical protein